MTYPTTLSESLAVVGVINPEDLAFSVGDYNTGAIEMDRYNQIVAIFSVGTMAATSKATFRLTQSETSGGTYTAITGKTAVQLTQAGTDSDKQVVINLDASEVGTTKPFVKAHLLIETADTLGSVIVLAGDARYGPASDFDLSSVDEIIK